MIQCAVFVFWCLIYCVKCEITGYELVEPTPVLKLDSQIQTTDARHPLKLNNELKPKVLTTGIDIQPSNILVKPSKVLPEFETTFAAIPLSNEEDPVIEKSSPTTRPVDVDPSIGVVVSPSAVNNVPLILETNAANPILHNKVVTPELITGIAEEAVTKPRPIIVAELDTKPIVVALTNDDPEPLLSSTGILIEPSQVDFKVGADVSSTGIATPNLENREPIKVSSTQLTHPAPSVVDKPPVQSVINPCICSSYEDITPSPVMSPASHAPGNALTPQFYPPGASKKYVPVIPNVFQHIINLQLNFYVNNFPVLGAHPPPYYY